MFFRHFFKAIALYLAFAALVITLPAPAWAMYLPGTRPAERQADLRAIRKALESAVVKQRLTDLGLSPAEAMMKINALSGEEVHRFASHLDSVQAGGSAVDALVIFLLVAVIALGVLELTGQSVIIR